MINTRQHTAPALAHKNTPSPKQPRFFLSATQQWAAGAGTLLLAALTVMLLLSTRNAFDSAVLSWVTSHRTAGMNAFMLTLTNAFTPADIVIYAFVLATGLAFWKKSFKIWFAFFGSVGVASVVGQVLKHIVGRTRPDLAFQIVHETDLSFPSGHATGVLALVAALYLAIYFTSGKSLGLKILGLALTLLAGLVCLSRIYVAAHWSTDVIAGAALGLAGTILWYWMTEKIFTILNNRTSK